MLKLNQVYHLDAINLLRQIDSESVDLILTDPPYGIGYDAGERIANDNRSKRKFSSTFGDDVLQLDWISEAARVLKQNSSMYIFTRWDVLHHTIRACETAGLVVVQRLIWDKLNKGAGDLRYYGSQTEDVLFIRKGKPHLNWQCREGNIWRLTKLDAINNEGNYDNPTQKPENLLKRAITRSSLVGELVVDPFVGSGSTAAAARALNRKYIVGDISEYQVSITRQRLSKPYTMALAI